MNRENSSVGLEVHITAKAQKELLSLPLSLQVATTNLINEFREFGYTLKEPKIKAIKQGLLELRATGADGISRSFFFFAEGKNAYIVHIFQKKTQKTPKKNLTLAFERMKALKQALKGG